MSRTPNEAVERLFADGYRLEYPQSGEVSRGRDTFAAVNERYPADGSWRSTVHKLIADDLAPSAMSA